MGSGPQDFNGLVKALTINLADIATPPLPITGITKPEVIPHTVVSTKAEFYSAMTQPKRHTDGIAYIRLAENINVNGPQLTIRKAKNIVVKGTGYAIHRTMGQITSHQLYLDECQNIKFEAVKFDDFPDGKFGDLYSNTKTKHMILVSNCKDITFTNCVVANSKGYALYVRNTDGFNFTSNVMKNSGILGLYIGHTEKQQSTRVVIEDNVFKDNATNALALLGVGGKVRNIVRGNLFDNNHNYGRWKVSPKYGTGYTGGGQVYIAEGNNILFEDNKIMNGMCINGYHLAKGKGHGDVHGLELGKPGSKVFNLTVIDNEIMRNNAGAINQNQNTTLDASVVIRNNKIYSNGIKGDRNRIKVQKEVTVG